jgi:hypothetical protein
MRELITDPEVFFHQRAIKPGLRTPVLVLVAVGLAYALDMAVVYTMLRDAEFTYGAVAIILATLYVLVPLVLWIGVGLVAFLLAKLMGARGRLGNVYRVTSFGFLPIAVSSILWAVGRYLASDPIGCEYGGFNCDPTAAPPISEQVSAVFGYAARANGDPLFLALFVAGLLVSLGSLYLWWLAVTEATTLDRGRAAVAVAVPYVGLIAGLVFVYLL